MRRMFVIFMVLQFWALPALAAVMDCAEVHSEFQGTETHASSSPHRHGAAQAAHPQDNHDPEQGVLPGNFNEQCCHDDLVASISVKPKPTATAIVTKSVSYDFSETWSRVGPVSPASLPGAREKIFLRTLRIRV